jgi:hypothetical protein
MIFFLENLRNPARCRRAGLMRQFRPGQVYSIFQDTRVNLRSTRVRVDSTSILNLVVTIRLGNGNDGAVAVDCDSRRIVLLGLLPLHVLVEVLLEIEVF